MTRSSQTAGHPLWLVVSTLLVSAVTVGAVLGLEQTAFAQGLPPAAVPIVQPDDDDPDDEDDADAEVRPVIFVPVTPGQPGGAIVIAPGTATSIPPATAVPISAMAAPVTTVPVTIGPAKLAVAGNRKHPPGTYSLPSEYVEKDKNMDGQIGLYEWSRSDLPAFHQLDLDRDGFLTPFEILKATGKIPSNAMFARGVQIIPVTTTSTSVPVSNSAPSRDEGRGENGRGENGRGEAGGRQGRNGGRNGDRRGGSRDEQSDGNTTESTSKDPATQRAEWAFTQMDQNRNDQIDQDEWTRSRTVRQAVEKAKLTVSTPLSRSDFVELFRKSSTTP